jgi:hypothetical protein
MLLFFFATRPAPEVLSKASPEVYEVKYRWMDRKGEIQCRVGASDGTLYPCTEISSTELDKLRVDWSDPIKKK